MPFSRFTKSITLAAMLLTTITTLNAADFNKDNIPDIVFKNSQGYVKTWGLDGSYAKTERWLTNLGSNNYTLHTEVGDLNKDGHNDILIQDSTTGYIKAIQMNGFAQQAIKWIGNPKGTDWKIVGTSDIDKNGYPDIVLQQTSTGYLKAFKLGSNFSATEQWIGNPQGSKWEVVKVIDVDNDNVADIVMQDNTLGYLKAFKLNTSFAKTDKWIGNPAGADWIVQDVIDVDGDNIADVVMQHTTLGYTKAFKLDSTFKGTAKWIGNPAGTDWIVQSITDVDGDGIADVVMQHSTLGYVKAFKLDSTFKGTAKWIGNPAGSDWKVVNVTDIDLDGQADILFQNTKLGYVKAFDIDATFKGTAKWVGNPAGSDWGIETESEVDADESDDNIDLKLEANYGSLEYVIYDDLYYEYLGSQYLDVFATQYKTTADEAVNNLQGTWLSECFRAYNADMTEFFGYQIISMNFNGSNMKELDNLYEKTDYACSGSIINQKTLSGTYKLRPKYGAPSSMGLDMTNDQDGLTYYGIAQLNSFASSAYFHRADSQSLTPETRPGISGTAWKKISN